MTLDTSIACESYMKIVAWKNCYIIYLKSCKFLNYGMYSVVMGSPPFITKE